MEKTDKLELVPGASFEQLVSDDLGMAPAAPEWFDNMANEAGEQVLALALQPSSLPEVIPQDPYPETTFKQPCAINAEIFSPEASRVMSSAMSFAENTLEVNRQKLREGDFESVPLPVNAIGTALKVVEIGRKYGKDSPQYKQAERGLLLDKDRRLEEAEAVNIEHYSEPITYTYDPITNVTYSDGLSYNQTVINGLSPIGDSEEVGRRPHDLVKLALDEHFVQRPDSSQIGVLNEMSCPDWAIEAFKVNPKGAHGGYSPRRQKRAFSLTTYAPEKSQFYSERVFVNGDIITDEVVDKGYQQMGVIEPGTRLDKTERYGLQVVVERREINDIFDAIPIFDQIASQETGQTVFMGEIVADDHPKDYQQVKIEAQLARERRRARAEKLKNYALDLAEQGYDPAMATVMENKFVKDLLLDAAEKEPEIAKKAFDQETARGFSRALELQSMGRFNEARSLIDSTRLNAPDASGCGAGSCGLETPDADDLTAKVAKTLLNVGEGDEFLEDKVRTCKCGGRIFYSNNAGRKSYKKLCMDCGALEKDGKMIREGNQDDRRQQQSWTGSISKYMNN